MLRNRVRDAVAGCASALPPFRGKGRLITLLDRFLTRPSDPSSFLAVADLNGARVRLDLREFGERFIFYYRRYEPQHVAMLRSLYPGGNFLDIGSNIGIYTVALAERVREAGGRIFSVEPIPSNAARQMENLALNRCTDMVDLVSVVLGERSGTAFMDGEFGSSNVNAVVSGNGSKAFPMMTLDEVASSRGWSSVRLLKIDVEGYEPAVFAGGMELIRRDRPVILAEFNRERMAMNGFDMAESWSMFRELGYTAHVVNGGRLELLPEPGQHENLFLLPG